MSRDAQLAVDSSGRLDHFLRRRAPHLSMRHIRRAIEAGDVSINGRPAKKGDFLHAGDVVDIAAELLSVSALRPQIELDLTLLYCDEDVAAVDKRAGMPSIGQRAIDLDTAANFVLARFPETAEVGQPGESGIVHRLDNATSGVLLAARTQNAYATLRRAFSEHRVRKCYQAIVHGRIDAAGEIALALRTRRDDERAVEVAQPGDGSGRKAATSYRRLRHTASASHVAVDILSGARHQVRAHLAAAGHPVIGDALYGSTGEVKQQRLLLHASAIHFPHPSSGERTVVESPLPDDFRWPGDGPL